MTFFLDAVLGLVALYLLTQIILPVLIPSELEINWLFKKKKPIDNTIGVINKRKRELGRAKDKAKEQISRKIKESKELDKAIK